MPVLINAAVTGDTAQGMRQRIDRDVLVHRPTLVTLSVGIIDVLNRFLPGSNWPSYRAFAFSRRSSPID